MILTPEKALGVTSRTLDRFAAGKEAGLPFKAIKKLQQQSGLSQKIIGNVIDVPKSTLRMRREKGRLNRHESDRLIRLGRIFALSVDLFEGNLKSASEWLQTPCRALDDQTPLDYASTELGAREVEAVIGRLEHGVFT